MVKSRGKRTAKRRDQHVEILWEEDMRETSVTRAEKEGELAGEAGCGGGVGCSKICMVLGHIQGFGLYPIKYGQPWKDFNRESGLTRLKFQ